MGISCGATLIKIILFVFNLIWLALGAAILYLGISVVLKYTPDVADVVKQTPNHAAIVLLAAGGVIFFISFLGCFGAIKGNSCCLNTYAGLILLCLVAQCVGAYLSLNYQSDLEKYAQDGINSTMHSYKWEADPNAPENKAINAFQTELKCCGAKSKHDWDSIIQQSGKFYPPSCCKDPADVEENKKCPSEKPMWESGCVQAIEDLLTSTVGNLGFVAMGLVLIQLLIIISACCLAREVGRYETYSSPKP